ncbi:hypothetical protein JJV70_01995 [Streptomyces sp. JJ66]|uniref:hypothetical protein n=1 Tax=Streptomyces sp. JJ66 TaxID=2803843 RepID=UPI001C55DD8D|nr:hypothetical protein [Streptomyces sp. JJ66]MBW1600892.1 hypothetical protein [Streptomyces sp. JJ66]
MRVVANERLKIFFGHVPTTLHEGQEASGALAAFLAERAPGKVTVIGPPPAAPQRPDELDPDASTTDVLTWTGDDPTRATAALEAEQVKGSPRKTLIKQLEKIIGG